MEDDGKKSPDEEDDLNSEEGAEGPSEKKEDSQHSDQGEFSLEGELIPSKDDEPDDASENQDDSELEARSHSDSESTDKMAPVGEDGEASEELEESSDDVEEPDSSEKESEPEETPEPSKSDEPVESDDGEEAESVVPSSETPDQHHEEDGYEHWHDDDHHYYGDGFHEEDHYGEETALASQVDESVTGIEPVEDEDIAALDEAIEEGHMTFLEHLEDLRGTLFKCAGTFLTALILVAVFFQKINDFLRIPLDKAMSNHGIEEVVVTTTPFGIFSYILQMAFLGALAISSPFLLYFVTTFVAPGLTPREKRALLPATLMALFLLCLGSAFSYFVLIPSALNVSIYFNELLGVSLMWSVDRYMNMLLWMVLGVGLIFEFPMVIAILVFVGLITVEQLRNFRRYAIVIMFVLSAFVTPTQDPITMLLMAAPLVLLYEGAILVSNVIEKRRKKAYETEYGSWDDE